MPARRSKYHCDCHNKILRVAENAASIASLFKEVPSLRTMDFIAETAITMAELETAPGFNWESGDWEEACEGVAMDIENKNRALTADEIESFINGRRP